MDEILKGFEEKEAFKEEPVTKSKKATYHSGGKGFLRDIGDEDRLFLEAKYSF